MRARSTLMALVVMLGAQAPELAAAATERSPQSRQAMGKPAERAGTPLRQASLPAGISCVPFARMVTGMAISGDARLWWHNAAGGYDRGQRPEQGSVLAFQASGGMRRGHVAVVSRVVSARQVMVDHANWEGPGIRKGTVTRGISVVDVSNRNDWTQVRVQVGHDAGSFGRVYPTFGFIYNRPPAERIWTTDAAPAAPRFQELADAGGGAAAPHAAQHLDLSVRQLGLAP
jgi:surface antigen